MFAHWPIDAAALRPLVPRGLEIQEFDGTSWIGVVPFRMAGVMRRPLPDLPWISAFPELNLRVYVERDRNPGVRFLSLDAANPLAVWAARRFFHLPYFSADISLDEDALGRIAYRSVRRAQPRGLTILASYRRTSATYESHPGTLGHLPTERYCLYARSPSGRLYRAEVHHPPWPCSAPKPVSSATTCSTRTACASPAHPRVPAGAGRQVCRGHAARPR